jgi:hypothetical protein
VHVGVAVSRSRITCMGQVLKEIPRLDPQADRRGVQRLLDGQERIKENTQRIGERIPPDSP